MKTTLAFVLFVFSLTVFGEDLEVDLYSFPTQLTEVTLPRCQVKYQTAADILTFRSVQSKEDALKMVHEQWKPLFKNQPDVFPRIVFVDMERMVREFYRKNKEQEFIYPIEQSWDFAEKEWIMCIENGF